MDTSQSNPTTTSPEVGELTVGEMRNLTALQQQAQNIVQEIGQLEVQKHRLLNRLAQYESKAQSLMNEIATRFNIPPGDVWHATEDGKVRLGPE